MTTVNGAALGTIAQKITLSAGLGFVLVVSAVSSDPATAEGLDPSERSIARPAGQAKTAGTAAGTRGFGFSGAAATRDVRVPKSGSTQPGRVGRGNDDALMSAGRSSGSGGATSSASKAPANTSGKPYASAIARHARANGVPVALAMAVVRIESNYNAKARGRAGEVGLMQIKPRTARGMGFSGSTAALYDPDTNLRWGMKYLAGAYTRAGGDTCGTIMRYQGGHYAKRMSKSAVAYCAKVKRHMAGQSV